MSCILIIDDDPVFRVLLSEHVTILGHVPLLAGNIEEGKELLARYCTDLVFLDVHLPDGNGLDMLPHVQGLSASPEVIIITGSGDVNGAELAIKSGAWDYLQKPLSHQEIVLHINRALEYHEKKVRRAAKINLKRDAIVGESRSIRDCLDKVAQCAGTDTGVLITGETGTGKELFARAIHANSPRSAGPFVVVDCTSLPDQLVESILFGYAKGAFTGADSERKGLIEQADGGTLFLDEVGELHSGAQKSFLRVLQDRVFRPVGKGKEVQSNFRLIAATHRNLAAMTDQDLFRSDLFFRLNTFNILLPPLREREQDIEKLTMHFVFAICRQNRLPIKGVVPESLESLAAYPWPGNVRELRNILEQAIIADPKDPVLYPVHLPSAIRLHRIRSMVAQKHETADCNILPAYAEGGREHGDLLPFKEHRRLMVNDIEKQYLQRLLQATSGNIAAACTLAHLSRSRLYDLLKHHSLIGALESRPE